MERLNSSQQTQPVSELEEKTTPVLRQEVTAITSTEPNSDRPKRRSPSVRQLLPRLILGSLIGAGVIAGGIYGYRWWQYAQRYQQTDDAYVTANIYPVTSRVAGIVTEVTVNDNQMVTPGTVLVKLDKRDYQLVLTQAKADLQLAKQEAALAKENLQAIISKPEPIPTYIDNQTKQAVIKDNLRQSQQINQQKEINQQKYKTAQAAIAQKEAEVKQAELQLSYADIPAIVGGKVGNKNVQVGQQVQQGQTLITVVQPNPWIVANFRENQLEKIQPGQNVEIQVAAFPSRKFQGKVDSISPTAFGKFALLPQENTAANALKGSDVQRIPVKIMFEPESSKGYESRFTPGMSAYVKVQTK